MFSEYTYFIIFNFWFTFDNFYYKTLNYLYLRYSLTHPERSSYLCMYINDQYAELSQFSHVCLFVCIYANESFKFLDIDLKCCTCSFFLLLICGNRRYLGLLEHIADIQTERSKLSSCMQNFSI